MTKAIGAFFLIALISGLAVAIPSWLHDDSAIRDSLTRRLGELQTELQSRIAASQDEA